MSLNVAFTNIASTMMYVELNTRLQYRGTDFNVYANSGYAPNDKDSTLLKLIMQHLFTDDSGVEHVHIGPFKLTIFYSKAVSFKDIESRVLGAARRTGKSITTV